MIVYCTTDLIFATKIRGTAEALGIVSRPARDVGMLRNRLDRVEDGKANGQVRGVLVDMEQGDAALEMIRLCKAHTGTLPVIAFGSHVAVDLLNQAHEAGADEVLPRSRFSATLPAILEQLSNRPSGA
ncbi:MAG: hypothetical protein GC164_07360 [Phycisphaera sp.]|nr:hypothetical protein [Phycisphaera sp.]